jgi:hypothetical protein
MESCLFCERDDDGARVKEGNDFVCSKCTQLLMATDPVKIRYGIGVAEQAGKERKARALRMFARKTV